MMNIVLMEGFLFRCLLRVPHEQRWAALGGPSVSSSAGAVLWGDGAEGTGTPSPPPTVCSASWYFCIRVLLALYFIDEIIYTK